MYFSLVLFYVTVSIEALFIVWGVADCAEDIALSTYGIWFYSLRVGFRCCFFLCGWQLISYRGVTNSLCSVHGPFMDTAAWYHLCSPGDIICQSLVISSCSSVLMFVIPVLTK